jgi:chromate transporter
MPEPSQTVGPAPRSRVAEVAGVFLRLGFTAFGGPAAHVAMIEREVVARRNWVDRQHFLDLVAAVNFIPGPNSTELAIHLGLIRAGYPGLVVAGACFIAPAVLIILPIAYVYVRYHQLPQVSGALHGIVAAVIAIIVAAMWRFARTGLKDRFTTTLSAAALVGARVLQHYRVPQAELIVLTTAAVLGAWWYAAPRGPTSGMRRSQGDEGAEKAASPPAGSPSMSASTPGEPPSTPDRQQRLSGGPLPAAGAVFPLATLLPAPLVPMLLLFLKIGSTLFGSGYVLAAYLEGDFVERTHWLTRSELAEAISVGQVTPGPLLTTSTFIGYVLGHRWLGSTAGAVLSAVLATVAIFLPSFILVAVLGPLWPRLRASRHARGALDGMNAAVVALIAIVSWQLASHALTSWPAALIAAVSLGVLLLRDLNATWVVAFGAVAGWLFGL